MIDWEGAEISYYYNGESYSIGLSDIQFTIIAKILGLEINEDGTINYFSDETLINLTKIKNNPLRLKKI